MHLFGSGSFSSVYEMLDTVYDDAGDMISFSRTMGNLNHGSVKYQKVIYELQLMLQSGVGIGDQGSENPTFQLSQTLGHDVKDQNVFCDDSPM